MFPLVKLAKKLKVGDFWWNKGALLFPLIKLAKKLKEDVDEKAKKILELVSIN